MLERLSGPENMQLDLLLLEQGGLRVYGWDGPWVSLGRFQKPEEDWIEGPVPYVMRPTGGRAVLHGHDLTIGLAATWAMLGMEPGQRSVRTCYRRLVDPLLRAMRACGIDACLGEDLRGPRTNPRVADCFAHISANDVVDAQTRRKACGCAMLMDEKGVLMQCSLPNGEPLVPPHSVIRGATLTGYCTLDEDDFARAMREEWDQFVSALGNSAIMHT